MPSDVFFNAGHRHDVSHILPSGTSHTFSLSTYLSGAFKNTFAVGVAAYIPIRERFSLSSYVQNQGEQQTFTVDLVAFLNDQTYYFTVDSLVQHEGEYLFAVDSYIKQTFEESFEVAASINKTSSESIDIDMYIIGRYTSGFSIDGNIGSLSTLERTTVIKTELSDVHSVIK